MKYLFLFFLVCIFVQDVRTMYFSSKWILVSTIIGCLVWRPYDIVGSMVGALLFACPAAMIYWSKKDWIGSADVSFLAYFGWILGYERMFVAMVFALLLAFLWMGLFKRREIPFLSCLSVGVGIAWLYGYHLWVHFIL